MERDLRVPCAVFSRFKGFLSLPLRLRYGAHILFQRLFKSLYQKDRNPFKQKIWVGLPSKRAGTLNKTIRGVPF